MELGDSLEEKQQYIQGILAPVQVRGKLESL
jgi:hypothetical protein